LIDADDAHPSRGERERKGAEAAALVEDTLAGRETESNATVASTSPRSRTKS
jgi:hypothetical protein